MVDMQSLMAFRQYQCLRSLLSLIRLLSCTLLLFPLLYSMPRAAEAPAIDGYQTIEQWSAAATELGDHPMATLVTIGQTAGGRDLQVLVVGTGKPEQTPGIAVVGGVDGNHPASVELVLRMARQLLADPDAAQVLDQRTFFFFPCVSPDEFVSFNQAPYATATGNSRATDADRDFSLNEDGPEDLNGDGWITMLRVQDPAGTYRTHPADSRVMIIADKTLNEQGGYQLYTEGRDNDADQQWNEDGVGGVQFNRNWPFRYEYFGAGAGPHQVSEPETRAVADYLFDHPEVALVLTFGPEDNLMHPWKPQGGGGGWREPVTSVLAGDAPYFDYIAELYAELFVTKDEHQAMPRQAAGTGSFAEWAYFQYGRWSLTTPGWWPVAGEAPEPVEQPAGAPLEESEDVGERGQDDLNKLAWLERVGVDGFAPWTPIDHPDFTNRKVEVGGFRPFLTTNPPSTELDELADNHLKFLLEVVDLLPRVEITELKVAELGAGLYRVSVSVINTGYLATISAMGDRSRVPYPLNFTLSLPTGGELITGQPRGRVEVLAGNGGTTELSWLVYAARPGRLGVSIGSPGAGYTTAGTELAHSATSQEVK